MSGGLDPRVNLILRQDNGKWMAMESGVGTLAIHAEADSLAELIAGPDAIILPIEQYGALVREREQAIREYERVRGGGEAMKCAECERLIPHCEWWPLGAAVLCQMCWEAYCASKWWASLPRGDANETTQGC